MAGLWQGNGMGKAWYVWIELKCPAGPANINLHPLYVFLFTYAKPYHLHVSIVLKSGSLNLLEPSGPVKACSGIALPFCAKMARQIAGFISF
jgi:hypothetical protein